MIVVNIEAPLGHRARHAVERLLERILLLVGLHFYARDNLAARECRLGRRLVFSFRYASAATGIECHRDRFRRRVAAARRVVNGAENRLARLVRDDTGVDVTRCSAKSSGSRHAARRIETKMQ